MASITHMGVAQTDHVLLYALRNITGGCPLAGYEFFRANIDGLGSAPNPDVDQKAPFHIRRGGHLVFTDVDWDYIPPAGRGGGGLPPGAGPAGPALGGAHAGHERVQVRLPAQRREPGRRPRRARRQGSSWPPARGCEPIVFPGPTVDPGGTSAGLQGVIARGCLVAPRR